jgi:hypothetical protein
MNGLNRSQFYGRMFPRTATPVDLEGEEDLRLLGAAMMDSGPRDKFGTFAGMTYFGQFIDHDLTQDNTKLEERNGEPNKVENFHAARLDLKLVNRRAIRRIFFSGRNPGALLGIEINISDPHRDSFSRRLKPKAALGLSAR